MTVLEVELAVLIVVLVATVVAIIVVHKRLLGAVYERQKTMDSYVKAVTRENLAVVHKANAAVAESQAVREEARDAHRRLEQHLSDPRVRRLTDG